MAEAARVRRPGGGRRSLAEDDPESLATLETLMEPATRGHPESLLRWTCKSTRRLAEERTRQKHPASPSTTTRSGLTVKAVLDTSHYDAAVNATDAELARLRLPPHRFHGEWDYTLRPRWSGKRDESFAHRP